MKKLKTSQLHTPDKESVYLEQQKYNVWLGNSSSNSFTSEKKAKKFLSQTDRFINEQMQDLNLILIDVFCEYRRMWFVIKDDFLIDQHFNNTTHHFRKIIKFKDSPQSNAYNFIDLIHICNELDIITGILINICSKHRNFILINYLRTYKKRIDVINKSISNYGK